MTGERSTSKEPEVRDATPCWAKLDWANGESDRLRDEVSRRDVVLDWLEKNYPQALELCPFKVRR